MPASFLWTILHSVVYNTKQDLEMGDVMRTAKKRIHWWLRMLLLVLSAAAVWCAVCFFTPNKDVVYSARDEAAILQDILSAYCRNQDLKETEGLLSELENLNEESAIRWKNILTCWQASTNEMPLHDGVLPDGLSSGNSLCLIVLGFQLNSDGSMQEELIGRLETALKSAQKYPNAYVLCTGGGTASAAPDMTEADAMAGWLMGQGIAENRIIVENRSLTTSQNAIFSCQILREDYPKITQAAIISSDYHIPWGKVLFETQFLLEDHPITVVSNAAYHTGKKISDSALLRYQRSGIMEIARID